ncbi:MAG: VPS10 domain-containing protein [bacterium]
MKVWWVLFLTFSTTIGVAEWVAIGPDGGNVLALAIDPGSSSRLLAIPYSYPDTPSVYVTTDSGASWQVLGRFGDVYPLCLAIDHHQPNRVYALNRTGNVLLSTDSGASWRIGSLPGLNNTLKPDPHTAGRVWVGGYDVVNGNYLAAVCVSTDYGETWTRLIPDSTALNQQIFCIAFDPTVGDVIWIGGNSARVYRTSDGGLNWEVRALGLPANSSVQSLSVNPANGSILLAATSSGLYRTTDAGEMWQAVGISNPSRVDFPLTNPARAYTFGYDSLLQQNRLFVSSDTGATWTIALPGLTVDKGTGFLSDPLVPDVAFINNLRGVFRTVDGGNNWSERHYGMRFAHISTISVNPVESSHIYLEFYENGIYKSTDGGSTWTRCADFLSCGNICGIGIAPVAGADILYALEGKG